jgi:hypothetical protein
LLKISGARAGARVAQATDHDPRTPQLTVTDRHRQRRLPQIPLTDLARPIHRPLMRAQLHEDRADLAQIVIHDRLAAIKPQRLDLLTHPHTRELRIVLQQPVDLVLERIQLRRPLRNPEHRRIVRPQRPHRVPRQPSPAHQLLDRHATNEMLSPQLRPALHVQHTFLPASINMTEPGSRSPRTPPPTSTGGVKSQPAKGGQSLTGADSQWRTWWRCSWTRPRERPSLDPSTEVSALPRRFRSHGRNQRHYRIRVSCPHSRPSLPLGDHSRSVPLPQRVFTGAPQTQSPPCAMLCACLGRVCSAVGPQYRASTPLRCGPAK